MPIPIDMNRSARHRAELPEAADVVVIGGGVAGIMSAYFLAQAGRKVVVCEKGRIAGEQSGRNWGWIRQQGRDAAELPIMMEAMRLWEGFSERLGPALGFRRCGVTYLANTHAQVEGYEAWLKTAAEHGVDSRIMGRTELAVALPNNAAWDGALITPSDARAEPWVAVPMLSDLAAEAGVVIRERCAVRTLERTGGTLTGVVTEAGTIRCEQVLLAAGAWSSIFARNEGLDLPQLTVRASVAQTQPLPEMAQMSGVDDVMAFRRRADGGFTLAPSVEHDFFVGPDAFRHLRHYLPQLRRDISSTALHPRAPGAGFPDGWRTPRSWQADEATPFEAMRILDPRPNALHLSQARTAFSNAFPQLGPVTLRETWAGMIDVMPDIVPVLDESPIDGLFIATGLSGHGFGIGPGVGRVMADMMLGRPPGHRMDRFRFTRFSDGSKIVLGP